MYKLWIVHLSVNVYSWIDYDIDISFAFIDAWIWIRNNIAKIAKILSWAILIKLY